MTLAAVADKSRETEIQVPSCFAASQRRRPTYRGCHCGGIDADRGSAELSRMGSVQVLGAVCAVTGALLLSACGHSGGVGGSPSPTPSAPTPSGPPTSTPPGAGAAELTITYNSGEGDQATWHLTCAPVGGDHPDPAGACQALATGGTRALPAVASNMACTQIYGGPQTATVAGTWRGQRVAASFKRTDGCEIDRWAALVPLLPKPGT
jgi:Subtilisin inhibitor-like